VFPFFTSGQPIAAIESDEAFMMLSLEPTHIASRPYIRLWLLYQNTTDTPYLLEPLNFVTLTTTRLSRSKTQSSTPESPTKILAHISNEKAITLIAQAIGGTLQEMSVKPTTSKTIIDDSAIPGRRLTATTVVNDREEKISDVRDRTSQAMWDTAIWYDVYENSINKGILRRNTVFPGQSVNGFIYFPFPLPRDAETAGPFRDTGDYYRTMDYMHVVAIGLESETLNIEFLPIEGE
jgi:hypothetical protein